MQKYRKFLVLLALSATALAVTGCGAAKNTAEKNRRYLRCQRAGRPGTL